MRLINTTTLQHETFTGTIPNYAILSHTWNPADITFVQFQNGIRNDKIRNFCARAREEGLEFGWIDFCCINRSNNAELHDAINSMYNWYERAVVCYTHLEDLSIFWSVRSNEMEVLLRACRWFTRGWTLIELIAPPRVQFYSADWSLIGTRDTLSSPISRLSGVPLELLIATKAPSDYEVSEKMGWAKNRKTRRAEDQAYSLMGLFGITMPIQYGEGGVAFARLREEIRKTEAFLSLGKQVPGLRLLVAQSSSLEIQSFHAGSIPDYAILSHTWSNDEVSFQDIQNGSISEESIGYQKIKSCCRLAASHGFRYLWVDTCCIDKSSSTELQEAICSMYEWYKSAKMYVSSCIITSSFSSLCSPAPRTQITVLNFYHLSPTQFTDLYFHIIVAMLTWQTTILVTTMICVLVNGSGEVGRYVG
jgi:hypothetical protein